MIVDRVENVLLVAHNKETPSDEEWRHYIDSVIAMGHSLGGDLRRGRMLVVTDGGSPTIAQRAIAVKTATQMHGSKMPVAVLSASRFVRLLVSTAGVVQIHMRSFAPDEMGPLFDFLGLGYLAARAVWAGIEKIDDAFGGLDTVREARPGLQQR